MESLYERNGLIFWTEKEIRLRRMFEEHFVFGIKTVLKELNRAFEVMQVEAPILTPAEFINKNYTPKDYFDVDDKGHCPDAVAGAKLILRPETTMGSYRYAQWLFEQTHTKTRMPLCVWQNGKSFRREQDQVTKNMRLKEFYQLEFQIIYATNTANNYWATIFPFVSGMISGLIGPCHLEESDRLPSYSERTIDVICEKTNMEVCSMSLRNDFPNAKVLEVAIGTDRCIYNFLEK